jgi:FtsP/CotA-like multicopper oxidase with cupredoxin domain
VEEETETIEPGETAELTVDLSKEGSYEIYCPINGHRDMGMEGTLTVGAASIGGGTDTSEDENEDGSTTSGVGSGYGSG